jgi:hypothetical protein
MYKDYIDFGIGMCVYFGDLEAFDVVEIDSGALCLRVIVSLVCPALYQTRVGFGCTYHACALFSLFCLSHTLHQTRDRVTVRPLYIRLQLCPASMSWLRVHRQGRRQELC